MAIIGVGLGLGAQHEPALQVSIYARVPRAGTLFQPLKRAMKSIDEVLVTKDCEAGRLLKIDLFF